MRDTRFMINSSQASRLPIVDFATYDLAGEIEVEIGQVCFWWTLYNSLSPVPSIRNYH